jgi:hypothetical protein
MKTKNLLSLLAFAGILIFASCKKEDPSPLTKDEAVTKLTTIDNGYSADITELNTNQGYKVENVINDMNLPFGSLPNKSSGNAKSFLKKQNDLLAKAGLSKSMIDINPDFTFSPGTYTYNKTTNDFTKTGSTPTNQMVLLFPYPLTNTTNNATLTIYDYLSTTILGTTYPTQVKGKIEIGGQVIWTMEITASYSNLTNYNLNVITTIGKFVFTQQASLNVTTSQITTTALEGLKKDGAIIYQFSSNGTFKPSQNNLAATIEAKIIIKDIEIRITYTFDFSTYQNVTDPNTIQKISVYTTGGAKIGDVKLVKVNNEWVPYIYFNNGDNKPVSDYFHDLLMLINGFMDGLFSNPTN